MQFNWKSMSDNELNAIYNAANSEISMRKEAAKQKAWDDFVRAFRKFAYGFGGVSIYAHGEEEFRFSNDMIDEADFEAMCQIPGVIDTDDSKEEDEDDWDY